MFMFNSFLYVYQRVSLFLGYTLNKSISTMIPSICWDGLKPPTKLACTCKTPRCLHNGRQIPVAGGGMCWEACATRWLHESKPRFLCEKHPRKLQRTDIAYAGLYNVIYEFIVAIVIWIIIVIMSLIAVCVVECSSCWLLADAGRWWIVRDGLLCLSPSITFHRNWWVNGQFPRITRIPICFHVSSLSV